ncbi:MAG TPA: hypothetical protein VLH08_10215 [Acidobacteriota bacterium]|nr:hypothetical protein [Acidobacteriota bacterium]
MTKLKIKVSKAALIGRINRRLKPHREKLCKRRSSKYLAELGEYYVVNFNKNFVVNTHVKPEKYARELGVLMDYEETEEI